MTGVLLRRWSHEDRGSQGEGHVTVKAEMGVMQVQAKERQRVPANHQKLRRGKEGLCAGFRGSLAPLIP